MKTNFTQKAILSNDAALIILLYKKGNNSIFLFKLKIKKTPLWHYTLFLLKKPISYVNFSCQMFHSLLNFPKKRKNFVIDLV